MSFGGSNGVPKHLWNLRKCGGSEIIWELNQPALRLSGTSSGRKKRSRYFQQENVEVGTPTVYGITRGSVDIHAMLTWLLTNGYLPSDSTLTQLEYGFEIASTGGVNEQFQVTEWSLTDDKTPSK